jgi:hypothetical protein
MDHAVPRLSLQLYPQPLPQPERRAPDLVACTQYLAHLAYLAYIVPWPTYILCVKSSQVNDM